MSFVFTLDVKGYCRHVLYLTLSSQSIILEVVHCFVHVSFPICTVSKIDTRNLFKKVYKL